jgi:hypothetical protein
MSNPYDPLLGVVTGPPRDWNAWVQQNEPGEVAAKLAQAQELLEALARWYGYVLHRRRQRHSVGVSRSNKLATAVRKALGEPFPASKDVVF